MPTLRLATHAMATRFEFVLVGEEEPRLRAAGEAALAEIHDWEARLSAFRPDSFLSFINRHAAERAIPLDEEVYALFRDAFEVYRLSGGAFDISIGPLMRAWGFRGEPPADEAGLAAALAVTGMDKVELDEAERTIRFLRAGVSIDLGSIGKGHALDRAADVLREAGVGAAFLHGGTSSVVAIGSPPERESGWGVEVALGSGREMVRLRDAGLSTSKPSGRMVVINGERIGHVVDARSGRPAARAAGATVVGPNARITDAWATALLVLGERPASMPAELGSHILVADGDRATPVTRPRDSLNATDTTND